MQGWWFSPHLRLTLFGLRKRRVAGSWSTTDDYHYINDIKLTGPSEQEATNTLDLLVIHMYIRAQEINSFKSVLPQ